MAHSSLAVFSDIHANLEALQAVIADMDALGIKRRVCLGDIVGYGANPAQCLELVRSLQCAVVRGNHDDFVATEDELRYIHDVARSGIEFARRKLSPAQREYLADLPLALADEGCEFTHASLDDPECWLYVRSERNADFHFRAQVLPVAFCGHTHVPKVWHCTEEGIITPWRGEGQIELPRDGKVLINAGSVGQPRDLCSAACYVIFDPKAYSVEFRRVPYDIAKARRKIMRAKLPRFAAQRLSLGR